MTDVELLVAFQHGDRQAFALLYDRYVDRLYAFVMARVRHQPTAEDLTSQTFLKAIEAAGRFQPRLGTVAAWFYQIARNLTIDHWRRKTPTEIVDQLGTKSEELEDQLDRVLLARRIRQALQEMPEDAAEIVTLRVWDDLEYKEIAQITNRSEGACRMAFSRALQELRRRLDHQP